MFKNYSRTEIVVSVWLTVLAVIVILSVLAGARWSTMALVFALSVAPMAVALLLGFGSARSMTTHELLYAVNNEKAGRS